EFRRVLFRSRSARGFQPAGQGSETHRGRRAGRGQRRVLHEARTRPDQRRLTGGPRRPRQGSATRRRRARPPVRPRPGRQPRGTAPKRRAAKSWSPSQGLQWALDGFTAGPAFVRNGRMDLLAVNPLARAFYAELYDMPGQVPNIARHAFLDERARAFYPDWDGFADITVAILRTEAARDPHNKELHDLIGELSTR